jgi:phosphoadenosine phosphosulfate reductase
MEPQRLVPLDLRAEPELDLDRVNREFSHASAQDLVAWAYERFGQGLVMSSSFGATAAVMLHLVSQAAPNMPILCIDTGYLFPETYRFAEQLQQRFKLNLRWYSASMTQARQEALYGQLWDQGDDGVKQYLYLNKVEPMQRALADLNASAWLAGLRADQTEHRAGLRRIDAQDGRIKVHPILHWSEADIEAYMETHDLPFHPLHAEGYRSIGDHHSTLPVTDDMDPRAGRILGNKRECGLHLPLSEAAAVSLKSSGL